MNSEPCRDQGPHPGTGKVLVQVDLTAAMCPLPPAPQHQCPSTPHVPHLSREPGSQIGHFPFIQASCPNPQRTGHPKGVVTSVPGCARCLGQRWLEAGPGQLAHSVSCIAVNLGCGEMATAAPAGLYLEMPLAVTSTFLTPVLRSLPG